MAAEALDIAAREVEGRGIRDHFAVHGQAAGGVDGHGGGAGEGYVAGKPHDLDIGGRLNRILRTGYRLVLEDEQREARVRDLHADGLVRCADERVHVRGGDEDLRLQVRG